jgi:hypothetical protein
LELFRLFGSIVIRDEEARDSIQNVENQAQQSSSRIGDAFRTLGGIIAGAFAIDAIKDFAVTMIETAADMQAMQGQYEQVMGGMKKDTDAYLGDMSKQWNKHPSELKSAYMQYVAILKSKGVEEGKAHEIAKQYLDRTVDANAFANEDMADTVARFMGGIKGEYDSLDTAMVNLSATMLNDMAVEKYGKKFDELTQAEQETMKAQEMLRQHTSAGVFGQGGREADSYANNLAMVKNTWKELLAQFGGPALEFANEKLKGIVGFLKGVNVDAVLGGFSRFGDYVGNVFSPIIDGIKSNFNEFMGFLKDTGALDTMKTGMDKAKEGFQWFKDNLPAITGGIGGFIDKFDWLIAGILGGVAAFKAMTLAVTAWNAIKTAAIAIQTAWNAILAMSPIGWVAIAIGALIAIGILLYKNWDTIVKVLGVAWEWLKTKAIDIWNGIKTWISTSWDAIKNKTSEVWNGLKSFLSGLWDGIKTKVSGVWDSIKTKTSSVWEGIKSAIMNPINSAVSLVEKAIGKIKGFFSGLILKLPNIKTPHFKLKNWSINPLDWIKAKPSIGIEWYAKGTNFAPGGLAMVGEQGPELVNLPRGSKVHTANQTKNKLGNSIVFSPQIVVQGNIDRDLYDDIMKRQVDDFQGELRVLGVKM